ncbi:tannase/feruloyl esterase family alpha/beta hydrolase [Hydrogenophaga pseudoflava]|uniref:tannase/feruloyl esterase family alpha/beta hydrolase n=1 Tax=Hydrogenophaga pseudoflava TaxID=47421 RepID=UPI0027E54EEE|nr:tannase/feruloyl esterase family alpha/beta hydrolase [Hydrogenophaga pseudoflava]MDQ7744934.1 tannase/feruloyl esterase family alpha/beta hydrolase [Hydrogenophaga pseudoflava]
MKHSFSINPVAPQGRRVLILSSLLPGALLLAACGGSDEPPPPASRPLAQSCASYVPSKLPVNARFERTELRKAQTVNESHYGTGEPITLPRACIVRGTIVSGPRSTIHWAVELPEGKDWNGKTMTLGGGGFDGFIPTDDPWHVKYVQTDAALPFVRISSDSGHQTEDFAWGTDPVALQNHAQEANHLALQVGTHIATQFYGKAPTRRYMVGHSNGGRSGLIAADRYPNDYDGVLAMSPAISQQAHQVNMGDFNRWIYGRNADGSVNAAVPAQAHWISPAKSALYAAAEIAACDTLDGLADGIIGNVEACTYVPADLKCADDVAGIQDDSCLTSGQIEAIRLNYADKSVPLPLANGMTGYERYGRGGAATGDWQVYAFGFEYDGDFLRKGFSYIAPTSVIQALTGSETADSMNHDPLSMGAKWQALSRTMEPSTDLGRFAHRSKLLVWYGLADTCVSVYRTASYLDQVRQSSGNAKFDRFARFVTSPGVGHDLTGPGAAKADLITALVEWVEKGIAPDHLVATGTSDAGTFERPLCPYPSFPKYKGSGDTNKASSFTCSVS